MWKSENFYGGHWDLGPTWNYAVMADKSFLVDSGRFGQGKNLVGMMESAGISAKDLEFVLNLKPFLGCNGISNH